jgi:tryptophan synthase alpha chain
VTGTTSATGLERIASAFSDHGRRAALMPYMMGGFPDLATSRAVAQAYVDGGADLVELGVPFSDPLADGPVIQAAATKALGEGTTLDDVLSIGELMAPHLPVVVMVYVNVVLAHGAEGFCAKLRDAGASGAIIPDLPLEESTELRAAARAAGLALVPLVAPTTPEERLARIGAEADGFVYAVSVTGTTGERATLEDRFAEVVSRAKAHTQAPVGLGFGISTPEQAGQAADAGADGVIVGSRLVRAVAEGEDVRAVVAGLADGLR